MRSILDTKNIHPAIHRKLGGNEVYLKEVQAAINDHTVVVVGMKQNPVCKAACKLLTEKGVEFKYLEYGSYLSQWKPRLAIKMWSGFPTFPQIFVAGTLVGGHSDLKALFESGEEPLPLKAE